MDNQEIPLSVPYLTGNIRMYLEECIAANSVSSVGLFVDRFEREFAAYCGSRYAVACASGTAALHVAMRLLEVGPGDEVFVPTLTFVASANPICYQGGIPVFIDAEADTWNLDPGLVEEEFARRHRAGLRMPKAVEVVHILGQPARIESLIVACDRHGVAVLEDAAEALGAQYASGGLKGRQVGTIGRIGCFSFNGNKVMTTGGGGMITTNDEAIARRARHLVTQAKMPGLEYRHDEVGYNYRLTNVAAAIGIAQLEKLPEFLERKRKIAARYDEHFRNVPGLCLPPRPTWSDPSYWLYSLRVNATAFGCNRTELIQRLISSGIQSRPIWTPLHLMPMYSRALRLGGQVAERLFQEALSIPCSVGLTELDQDRVIRHIVRS